MALPEAHIQQSSFVRATINYIDTAVPVGVINDIEREKTTLQFVQHSMEIHDARPVQHQLGLEKTGFVFLRRPSRVGNFFDMQQVYGTLFPEAARLVQELTGAVHVGVFGEALRNAQDDNPKFRPVLNAHVDYDQNTVLDKAREMLPPGREDLIGGRIMLINLWRPITRIEKNPLAVCDASTVASSDLHAGRIGGVSRTGTANATAYSVSYNPAHRWNYVSDMEPQEVLVFKLCDTRADAVQWTAHTSFDHPGTRPDAPGRQSIEVRAIAFLG